MKLFSFLIVTCLTLSCADNLADTDDMGASDIQSDMGMNADVLTKDLGPILDLQTDGTGDVSSSVECEVTEPYGDSLGHLLDGWVWKKTGRLFPVDPVPASARQGDFSPSVIKVEEGYRLYFARRRDEGATIWTSKSSDGVKWEAPVIVKGLTGPNVVSAVYKDGEIRLWFGTGSFATARSTDGVNFEDQVPRVVKNTDVGALGSLSILDAKVYSDEDGFKMWYTGFDGALLRIGTANSTDGIFWRHDGLPVLEGTMGMDFDSKSVAAGPVLNINGLWHMWYSGYDISNSDPGPWRIGLATSPDAKRWTRKGVSIALSPDGDDIWSTRDASVFVNQSGGLSMVYVGMSNQSHYRLLSASTQSCY